MENTIPNIKQSALEYFVYTIRDRRERRKLLRFAQKHYTPSENFIWGPPRKEETEGGKPQKMPAPPASGHNSQTSMHKKSKDSKNSSSAAHVSSKAAEEKKVAPSEPGEGTDGPGAEPSGEAAGPGDAEKDGGAENPESPPEKTASPAEKKESASPPEKDKEGDGQNKDCENPGNTGPQDAAPSLWIFRSRHQFGREEKAAVQFVRSSRGHSPGVGRLLVISVVSILLFSVLDDSELNKMF